MIHTKAVFLLGSFVVFGACAHNPSVATPVTVTITSPNASNRFLSDVRKATLEAVSKHVPEARPMTVAVDLDVKTETLATTFNTFDGGSRQRLVPSMSSDTNRAANEGALPTVEDHGNVFFPYTMLAVTEVNVSYTIKDGAGKIIESDRTRFDMGSPISHFGEQLVVAHEPYSPLIRNNDPFSIGRILVRDTSGFLASRVKALSH
jgi:hypothetical protein